MVEMADTESLVRPLGCTLWNAGGMRWVFPSVNSQALIWERSFPNICELILQKSQAVPPTSGYLEQNFITEDVVPRLFHKCYVCQESEENNSITMHTTTAWGN
jgi:hypothetical protein